MVKTVPLDKIISVDTEIETEPRQVLVIKKVGTDSSSKATILVDQVPCCEIITNVAPLRVTSSNLLGPLDLGDLYIVVPPESKLKFTGASGSKLRIIGEVLQLDPGEAFGDPYKARYNAQGKNYVRYISGSLSLGTDVAWAKDAEHELVSLTPATVETYIFDGFIGVSITGDTVNPGDFGVKFYLDNIPLEYMYAANLQQGIDALSMPLPPADSTNEVPFSLKDFPIEVAGDHTLTIKVRNTSGADKAPASGSSWSVTLYAVCKYFKKG